MRPVFVLGVGAKGREVVRRFKERIEGGGGRPYLVYCAIATQRGEGAPLEPITEDYLLAPASMKTQIAPEDLTRYSPLVDSEPVRPALITFLRMRDGLQALFSQKTETLFSQEQWVGAPGRTGEDIVLYLIVDLADPLCLPAIELLRLTQTASRPYKVQAQALLLALEESHYIYPVLQEAWEAVQGHSPLLSQGVFLIEGKNEWGDEATEEERLTAVVEWLERVVNERLPYHDDVERPHLGSWGMAQGVVPRERLNHFFALQWGSEFLQAWTKAPTRPMPSNVEALLDDWWEQIDPLVQKPIATAAMPPSYNKEVDGQLAPSHKLQQDNCRLYPEGRLPGLSDELLQDIRTNIENQETKRHANFLRNLQEKSKEVQSRACQRLGAQIQEVFGHSRHPFAENAAFLDQALHRLEEARGEAEDQIVLLNKLEQQGLFQERAPAKPSVLVQIWRNFLFFLVTLMALEGLFMGIRNLLRLWPLVQEQPLPFLGVVGLLIALVALVFYDIQVIVKRKGIVIVFLFLPLALGFRDLILWNVLLNVGLNLFLLLLQLWPKFQLYELSLVPKLKRINIADNYQQAESYAENALTRFNVPLLIYRFFALLAIFVVLLIQAHRIQGTGFWDLWATFPSNWPRWLWPPISLAAVFLSKYFFVDVIGAEARWATGRLIIPAHSTEWRDGLLRLVLIGWVIAVAMSLYLKLSNQEWITALGWEMVLSLVALARYAWEYFNDRERLLLLREEWVKWHDRMAFLRFHLEAWREASRFYRELLENISTLKRELEQCRETLREKANEMSQQAEGEAVSLERDAHELHFPRYVMVKAPYEFYKDFLQEAGSDLEGRLILEYGAQLWAERSDSAAVDRALSCFIDQRTQAFWQERTIVQLLGPNPDITWMLKPAHPFWSCMNTRAPSKVYLGLPPLPEREEREHRKYYEEVILSHFGGLPPTKFDEDSWTVTALYYRYEASPDDLGSLPRWQRAYEEEIEKIRRQQPMPPLSVEPAVMPEKPTPPRKRRPARRRKKPAPQPPIEPTVSAPEPMLDYYTLLGVTPEALPEEIQQAYQHLVEDIRAHPGPEAASRLQQLDEVYDVLMDPERRKEYDGKRGQ